MSREAIEREEVNRYPEYSDHFKATGQYRTLITCTDCDLELQVVGYSKQELDERLPIARKTYSRHVCEMCPPAAPEAA